MPGQGRVFVLSAAGVMAAVVVEARPEGGPGTANKPRASRLPLGGGAVNGHRVGCLSSVQLMVSRPE